MLYPNNESYKVYLLNEGGKSQRAATTLLQYANTLAQISSSKIELPDLFDNLEDHFGETQPHILEAMGLQAPAIQVRTYKAGLPRAIRQHPHLYVMLQDNKEHWWFFSPVDYKGWHFSPPDAQALDSRQAVRTTQAIASTENAEKGKMLFRRPRGCATPDDFNTAKHYSLPCDDIDYSNKTVFIAYDESLKLVKSYLAMRDTWDRQCLAIRDKIYEIVDQYYKTVSCENPELAFEHTTHLGLNLTHSETVAPLFYLKVTDAAGRRLPLDHFLQFNITAMDSRSVVTPNDSTEGRRLKNLFDALPLAPSLTQYPGLAITSDKAGQSGKLDFTVAPEIKTFDDIYFLLYPGNISEDFCPQGAVFAENALITWLHAAEEDEKAGIEAPSMPERLIQSLNDTRPGVRPVPRLPLPIGKVAL